MDINDLSQYEILQGTFSLIFAFISLTIGILFIIRYLSNKQIEFVTIGLTWIFFSSGWWGSTFSFLSIILFQKPLNLFQYLFISNVFFPISLITWVYSICHILYPEWESRGLIIAILIIISFEIILITLLVINPQNVGNFDGTFNIVSSLFLLLFELILITILFITGLIFSIKSMQINDPIIKKRGLLLLIAFILTTISLIAESFIFTHQILFIIMRLMLISSSIVYYLAFFYYR